jgi:hypothetical protein
LIAIADKKNDPRSRDDRSFRKAWTASPKRRRYLAECSGAVSEGGIGFASSGASARSISQTALLVAAARDLASPDLIVLSSNRTVHFQESGPLPRTIV